MLFFNKTNIFTYKKELNDKYVGFLASDRYFLPFQLVIPKDAVFSSVTELVFQNDSQTFASTDIQNDLEILEDTDNIYIIFKRPNFPITALNCGTYQLKITVEVNNYEIVPPLVKRYYYSNFFTIVPDSEIVGIFNYSNSFDFDNKIYQTSYKNVLNFVNQTLNVNPFYKEIATERADGSKVYEYQSYSEIYTVIIFGDIWTVREIQKIQFFDTQSVTIIHLNIIDENIHLRNEVQQSFEDNRYYKITLSFTINNIEKNLCESNKEISEQGELKILEIDDKILLIDDKIFQAEI